MKIFLNANAKATTWQGIKLIKGTRAGAGLGTEATYSEIVAPLSQHYGFSSMPPDGTEVVLLKDGESYVGVAEDDRYRPLDVGAGDTMVYTLDQDNSNIKSNTILLKHDGRMELRHSSLDDGEPAYQHEIQLSGSSIQITATKADSGPTVTVSVVIDTETGQVNINDGNLTVDV